MPAKIPQDVRERQLRELADADGYSFVGWVDGYKNAHSKVTMRCLHHGEWDVRFTNFYSTGSRCVACGGSKSKTQVEASDIVNNILSSTPYRFITWETVFSNQYSRLVIECPYHGKYLVQFVKLIGGQRCRKCALGRLNQDQQSDRLHELADADNVSFLGFNGVYEDVQSRAYFNCAAHGSWTCSIASFVAGSRCPDCSGGGYDDRIPGTLYALLSECGTMIKVGISNRPSRRHVQLANSTPFKFSVHRQIQCEDGSVARMLEREFHNEFMTAGLSGFDGATEWLMWHDDVNIWFDLLDG